MCVCACVRVCVRACVHSAQQLTIPPAYYSAKWGEGGMAEAEAVCFLLEYCVMCTMPPEVGPVHCECVREGGVSVCVSVGGSVTV